LCWNKGDKKKNRLWESRNVGKLKECKLGLGNFQIQVIRNDVFILQSFQKKCFTSYTAQKVRSFGGQSEYRATCMCEVKSISL